MDKCCFNCAKHLICPILKGANEEDYDGTYETFIFEYGKNCIDFVEK